MGRRDMQIKCCAFILYALVYIICTSSFPRSQNYVHKLNVLNQLCCLVCVICTLLSIDTINISTIMW